MSQLKAWVLTVGSNYLEIEQRNVADNYETRVRKVECLGMAQRPRWRSKGGRPGYPTQIKKKKHTRISLVQYHAGREKSKKKLTSFSTSTSTLMIASSSQCLTDRTKPAMESRISRPWLLEYAEPEATSSKFEAIKVTEGWMMSFGVFFRTTSRGTARKTAIFRSVWGILV